MAQLAKYLMILLSAGALCLGLSGCSSYRAVEIRETATFPLVQEEDSDQLRPMTDLEGKWAKVRLVDDSQFQGKIVATAQTSLTLAIPLETLDGESGGEKLEQLDLADIAVLEVAKINPVTTAGAAVLLGAAAWGTYEYVDGIGSPFGVNK